MRDSVERGRKWRRAQITKGKIDDMLAAYAEEVQKGAQMFTDKTDKWDESHPEFKVEQTKDGRFVKSEEVQQAPVTGESMSDKAVMDKETDWWVKNLKDFGVLIETKKCKDGTGYARTCISNMVNERAEKAEAELTALESHCERLREALDAIADPPNPGNATMCECEDHTSTDCCSNVDFYCPQCIAGKALATTPSVSLEEHDREVRRKALKWAAANIPDLTVTGLPVGALSGPQVRNWLRAQAGVTNNFEQTNTTGDQ